MIVRILGEGQFNLPGSAIDGLNDIDNRMVEAVATEDWPRFRSLLDEMVSLVGDLGEPAPLGELVATFRGAGSVSPGERLETLQNVKRVMVELVTARRQMQQRADRARGRIARLDRQARQSADAGRDDLARLARQRKQNTLLELEELNQQIVGIEREQEQLTQAVPCAEAGAADVLATTRVEAELAALKDAAGAQPERET